MRKHEFRRPGLTLMELIVVVVILVVLAGIIVPLLSNTSANAQQTATLATMTALRNAMVAYYQDMKGIPLARPIPGTAFIADSTGMPQTLKDLQIQPTLTDSSGNSILFNPVTGRGWRGPYLLQATGTFLKQAAAPSPGSSLDISFYPSGTTPIAGSYSYGSLGDIAFLDAWGNPIVLQWPAVGSTGQSIPAQDLALRVQDVRLVSAGPPSLNASGYLANVIDTPLADPSSLFTPAIPAKASRGNDMVLFILIQDPTP